MRVFAIGDLHLEGGTGKTMDRFGDNWVGHDRKIFEAWDRIGSDDDLLVIAGDSTWAPNLAAAIPDLERIGRMKGRKIIIKGNHDYWWETKSKLVKALPPSMVPLQSDALITDGVAIAGTRGWNCPGSEGFTEKDTAIYQREVGRLRLALERLAARKTHYDRLIVALHYPPTNSQKDPSDFTGLIDEFKADACVYGHLHGEWTAEGLKGRRGLTTYHLVSADFVDFQPVRIL
jgi:predicted phosphohydrolase